ncbi:MAG: PKD domain-containing protein, partial [Pedosphaera sp.]|nr:PKD domain-containing protein [Pedosphaera sp.]
YALGFTEAAGNFQSNNFARGGVGGDAVQADAQDGSGVNNANMSTPGDGFPPRMQMFIFNYPNPDRDGDFDAEIVLHEYTHGLSNRRVGGGVGLSASQSRGMGEGWSDFYALALLSEPGDAVSGNYAMGGYATFQFIYTNYLNNYYFGIRRYPYATDLTKNPLTFKDIDPPQASAHAGVPLSPLFTPFSASSADEVHSQGEVWCATLWEARANFVNTYGGSNGNWLFLQLVTDGLNLAPANPNFLEARDAIVLADQVAQAGANSNLLWTAFAKRGLGFSAYSPGSDTTAELIEAFDLPNDLRVTPPTGFVARGPLGGPFTNTLSLTLSNSSPGALNWSLANTSAWLVVTPASGTLAGGAATTVTAEVGPAALSLASGIYPAPLQFTNLTSGGGPVRQFTLLNGPPHYFTEGLDGFAANDLSFTTFNFTADGSANFYAMCHENAVAYPTDPAGGTTLALTDDSFAQITLSGTNTIALFGQRTNRFFIGSNGYLTLHSGDTAYLPYYPNHFNRVRVSGLFKDLLPSVTGTVSWRELGDRVAATWNAVAEFGTPSLTNSFQIELFFDGRLRVTYLTMNSVIAIAGLSPGGGTPPYFEGTDLSEHPVCVNPPLVLLQPVNQTVGLDQPASFSVTAFGAVPLRYQWLKNGAPVSGTTNATLNFAAAVFADSGGYSAQITNAFGAVTSAVATLSVSPVAGVIPVNGSAYAQNFDALGAVGAGTPFGWYAGAGTGAISGTNVTVGDGSSNAGGNYNLGTSGAGDRALGSLASNSGGQRDTEARFINLAGRAITSFNVSYAGEQWRVGGNGSVNNDLVLQFSLDGASFTALGGAFNFNTPLDSGASSALDGNAASNRVAGIGGTFTPAAALTNLQVFYLRWADEDNSSSDHAMAADDFVITFTLSNPPPPVVNFTATPTTGLAPLAVNFTNLTTGATNYAWNFGDGNVSAALNPANTFSNAGSYNVTLTATGLGGTSSLTLTNYITTTNAPPPPPPVVAFTADLTNGLAPLVVNFTNLTTGATNFAWDFGDGNISADADPANTFTNAGAFSVTLTADGPGGTSSLTLTNYITTTNAPPPPVADFIASATNGYILLTVYFTNLSSGATNYTWDFGDGNFSSTTDGMNTFSNAGNYTITLTAIGAGGTNSLTRTSHILAADPPVLLTPQFDGDGFKFAFETLPGRTYTVQFKDSLDDTNWTPLPPPVLGDGLLRQFTNPPPGATRFFRVASP